MHAHGRPTLSPKWFDYSCPPSTNPTNPAGCCVSCTVDKLVVIYLDTI